MQRHRSLSPEKHGLGIDDNVRLSDVLNSLTKGYLMLKHSERTQEPHNKFIYLSEDQKFLCWKSLDKKDEKKI
jgi:hypothetical protein